MYFYSFRLGGCFHSSLNGLNENNAIVPYGKGIIYKTWRGLNYSLKAVEMAVNEYCPTEE